VQVEDGDEHDEPCKEADGQVWTLDHARENAGAPALPPRIRTPIPQEV
jgi:hypothetical protein